MSFVKIKCVLLVQRNSSSITPMLPVYYANVNNHIYIYYLIVCRYMIKALKTKYGFN